MLYIIAALKPEAQAFVDKYRLKKTKLNAYTLYFNDDMRLIISGLGNDKAREATQTLIDNYDITNEDIYLNIGICAANTRYSIGELIEAGSIAYKGEIYPLQNSSPKRLTCLDAEAAEAVCEIADMESFGFYDAIRHSPAIKNFHVLKVVSDHFEPQTVTKEKTKSLIFNMIDAINKLILNHPYK
ncbi:hypothetical protein KJ877_03525 [bacterium]|nr:hypothetical protein [bacterium]MBU1990579.1 hypothetical protein [bacterium]